MRSYELGITPNRGDPVKKQTWLMSSELFNVGIREELLQRLEVYKQKKQLTQSKKKLKSEF